MLDKQGKDIIERIESFLPDKDLGSLILVCKRLKSTVYSKHEREHLSHKYMPIDKEITYFRPKIIWDTIYQLINNPGTAIFLSNAKNPLVLNNTISLFQSGNDTSIVIDKKNISITKDVLAEYLPYTYKVGFIGDECVKPMLEEIALYIDNLSEIDLYLADKYNEHINVILPKVHTLRLGPRVKRINNLQFMLPNLTHVYFDDVYLEDIDNYGLHLLNNLEIVKVCHMLKYNHKLSYDQVLLKLKQRPNTMKELHVKHCSFMENIYDIFSSMFKIIICDEFYAGHTANLPEGINIDARWPFTVC